MKRTPLKRKYKKKDIDDRMRKLFLEIWEERPHYSEISGKWLGNEPLTIFFDHLLEKEMYEWLKYEKKNIILCTGEEHKLRTDGWPLPKHQKFIDKAKQEFLND